MISKDIFDKDKVTKDDSLLEIAVKTLRRKRTPQNIYKIISEVMEQKGLKKDEAESLTPQFVLDFMLSGYFVYCGDNTWDLKERQPLSVLDKEGGDYDFYEEDEDVKKNELTDEQFGLDYIANVENEVEDADEDDEETIDEDDLTNEFDNQSETLIEDEELDEEFDSSYTKSPKSQSKLKLSDEDDDDDDFEDEE